MRSMVEGSGGAYPSTSTAAPSRSPSPSLANAKNVEELRKPSACNSLLPRRSKR